MGRVERRAEVERAGRRPGERLNAEGDQGELRVSCWIDDKSDVEPAFQNVLLELRAGADHEFELKSWVSRRNGSHIRRQASLGEGFRYANSQDPAVLQTAVSGRTNLTVFLNHRRNPRHEGFAALGECETASGALEHGAPEFRFEMVDAQRNRRGRHVQVTRRLLHGP